MKDLKHYDMTMPYPTKDQFTKVFVYQRGRVLVDGVPQSVIPPEDVKFHEQQGHTVEFFFDEDAHNTAMLTYHSKEQALYDEFKQDLFAEFGVTDNPKANLLFAKAWDRGHAHGFPSVHGVFSDLVELIQ